MSTGAESTPRRGLGRGFEVLIGGSGRSELAQIELDQIHPEPTAAAQALRQRAGQRPRRVDPRAGPDPAGRRSPPPRGRVRADRRRAALAGGPRCGARHGAGAGARGGRPRHAPARAGRERRARGSVADRGGARLRAAAGRVRACARRGRRTGRQVEADGVEPRAAARAAGRRAGHGRAGRAVGRPRPRGTGGSRPRRAPPAGPPDHRRGLVGAGRPSGPPAGRARGRRNGTRAPSTPKWRPGSRRRSSCSPGSRRRSGAQASMWRSTARRSSRSWRKRSSVSRAEHAGKLSAVRCACHDRGRQRRTSDAGVSNGGQHDRRDGAFGTVPESSL